MVGVNVTPCENEVNTRYADTVRADVYLRIGNAPLNKPNAALFYGAGAAGYTDYPALAA